MMTFELRHYLLMVLLLVCFSATAQEITTRHEFYPNKQPRAVKHEGLFNGCGMPVGTDSLFYETGELMETIFHDNRESKTEKGCHATWTTLVQQWYYKNGKIKHKAQLKTCYECNSCHCGLWTWYNEKGIMIRKKSYGDCYDQQPCLDK